MLLVRGAEMKELWLFVTVEIVEAVASGHGGMKHLLDCARYAREVRLSLDSVYLHVQVYLSSYCYKACRKMR